MGGVADGQKTRHSPHVARLNVVIRVAIRGLGELAKLGSAGAPSTLGQGMADPIKTSSLPICVTASNVIGQRQKVYR